MADHTTHFDDCGCLSARLTARIAELEAELADERQRANDWMARVDSADHEGCAWMEHANTLRGALEDVLLNEQCACCEDGEPTCCAVCADRYEDARTALASTPAADLSAYRASVLEEAAKECEVKVIRPAGHRDQWEGYGCFDDDMTGPECAQFLRALAAQAKQEARS